MNLNRKVFYLVWVIHLLLTAMAGIAVIWVSAAATKSGVQVNQSSHEMLQLVRSILLFPIKPILGEWLVSSGVKWLFFPAIIVNSFMWAYVVALAAMFSRQKQIGQAHKKPNK